MQATDEQHAILTHFADTANNLVISAVPGSGKTTTISLLAKAFPERYFLVLSFGRNLREETVHKFNQLGLRNVHVCTVNSSTTDYYQFLSPNAIALDQLVHMPDRIITPPKAVDVFVVDECQDLDEGLNQLTKQRPLQLVFLGDPLQAIYGYRGGDARYLTMVSDIYPDRQWGRFGLSVSHRLTEGVVDYMKQHITGMEKEIIKLHDHFSVAYDDIIILANSTKLVQYNRPTTVGELDQQLTLRRIPLFIAGDLAESKLDLQRGKLRIMTFIRSKGLQCRHTFLVDYGTKKFRYEPQLPTSVFVAMTRATDTLGLPAVQMELKRKREELITDRADKAAKQPKTKKMLSVGQLLSHLPQRQMIDAFRSVNIRTVYEESYRINIRNQSTQEYNGIRLH
ncbi:P-loop containing nucleoside triphosphate hydrolase protein [Polychytrium aggregatum]|uniref:P-loop containing nucleoside triphosphate hydrolase protein n=1 Tax=Polychytrium aggregatum TaxID=110093 RepID=UPI0022FDB5C7|nr:P-loop containing nucleoside triphosphate hydrolase protein [Polychytrium aggregatum]KAI9206546.1 P-loop containing nucleoside triphosphate hydrolase protein [Polychytrium aggregatum]